MATLINLARRLRARPRARFSAVIQVVDRGQVPQKLKPRRLYAIGSPHKWVVFECPCGRGHQIHLNLAHPGRAQWTLAVDEQGRPTLFPSIDVRAERRCHYWLRHGRTHWA